MFSVRVILRVCLLSSYFHFFLFL